MSQSFAIWAVIGFAVFAANLPFLSQRVFAVVALVKPKSLWMRLGELLVFYCMAGGFGMVLEKQAGQIATQTWEFYAITVALFLTFAFPGFVYRYLLKHRG